MYNTYGYNESASFWSMGHQIRHDLNHFRRDNNMVINNQTEVLNNAIKDQTKTQTEDAEKMRTNQTTLVGKIIEAAKFIFTGKSEKTGGDESFFQMVQRENTETQEWLEKQANEQKNSIQRLGSIIDSLNDIADEVENDTNSNKTNTTTIKNAIAELKAKTAEIAEAIKEFKPVNVNSINI